MTVPVGGLRERFVHEAVHLHLRACLEALGWFNDDKNRKPVTYQTHAARDDEQVTPNTIATFSSNVPPQIDLELGSDLGENHYQWWADVYAEDEAVGVHLSGDIRDILRGRMPSIGADRPVVVVYDFEMATPTPIFACDVEDVSRDRPVNYVHPWQQFWFAVAFTVVDSYNQETDTLTPPPVVPSPTLFPSH